MVGILSDLFGANEFQQVLWPLQRLHQNLLNLLQHPRKVFHQPPQLTQLLNQLMTQHQSLLKQLEQPLEHLHHLLNLFLQLHQRLPKLFH